MMYPEVRAAVEADTSPDLTAPGFDVAAHREHVRLANLRLPREDVASVADVDADGVRCRLFTPADALPGLVVHAHGGGFVSTTSTSTTASAAGWPTAAGAPC